MLTLLLTAWLATGVPWSDCPPVEDWLAGEHSDRHARKEYRRRAHEAWKSLGLSHEQRQVLDAIAWRETRWDACAVHRLGKNEDGLGLGGNMVKYHLRHWGGERGDMRVPEVSALIMARVVLRTVKLYGCRTWKCVGRIYGGAGVLDRDPWRIERWCKALWIRGVSCRGRAKVKDIGIRAGGWERNWLRKIQVRRLLRAVAG